MWYFLYLRYFRCCNAIDAQTDQPIQDAHVQKENNENDHAVTDERGSFEIWSISGGLFGCPPMMVIVSKEGYESKTVEIYNAEHETIKYIPDFVVIRWNLYPM